MARLLQWHLAGAAAVCAALRIAPDVTVGAAIVGLLAVPRFALPAIAVLAVKGLGEVDLGGPIVGQLRLTDLCLIAYVVRFAARPRVPHRPPAYAVASIGFFTWTVVVTVVEGVSYNPLLRIVLYVFAGLCVAGDKQSRDVLQGTIVFYACVELARSIPEIPGRLIGATLGDPALFGALMLVAIIIVAVRVRVPLLRLAALGYLGIGVVFSQTRSVWFATAAVVTVVFLRGHGRLLPIAVPVVGALVGLPVVPWLTAVADLNADSGALRSESMRLAIRVIQENPLTGLGWAYLAEGGPVAEVGAYNLWLFVGASTGVIGLALFAGWMLLIARDLGARDIIGYLALTAMLAMGLSEMPIYAGSVSTLVFLLLISPPLAEPGGDGEFTAVRSVPWRRAWRPSVMPNSVASTRQSAGRGG